MTTRIELPSRRRSVTHKVRVAGATIYLNVGFYDDEQTLPGELFITLDKAGEGERILCDILARTTSYAIQCGTPLEGMMDLWLGVKGRVAGPVYGDPHVRQAESAVDYIAKHMLIRYCHRDNLRNLEWERSQGAL